jgi:hypothetical protein
VRTWTTKQERAYDGIPYVRVKVEVKDSGGTWRNWGDLDGVSPVAVEWGDSLSQPKSDGTLEVIWKSGDYHNLSPRISGKIYDGYLDLWREIKIHVKVFPSTASADDYSWIEAFHGRVDEINLATNPGTITFQQIEGIELQSDQVDETKEYGDDDGLKDVEDVIDDLLTDFSTTGISLYTPSASGLQIRQYEQKKMPLMQAIQAVATTVGWDCRPMWDDGTSSWRLTLYEPDRSVSTSAHTFSASDIVSYGNWEPGRLSWIRNMVRVWYLDHTATDDDELDSRDVVERTDETSPANDFTGTAVAGSSIDKYGPKKMFLAETESQILRGQTAAETLADAALADLADPRLNIGTTLRYLFWPIQLNDYITLEADGHRTDSDTDLAVHSYRHRVTAEDEHSTELTLIEKPALDRSTWLRREARPGVAPEPEEEAIAAPTLTVSGGYCKNFLSWDWPQHSQQQPDRIMIYRSTSSGFTPSSANLVAELRGTEWTDTEVVPSNTYYYVARWKTSSLNYSQTSTEDSASPSKWTEGTFLNLSVSTTSLQSSINTNTSDISTLQSDLTTAEGDISTNTSNISSNDTDIATNASDITSLENAIDLKGASASVDTSMTNYGSLSVAVEFDDEQYDSAGGYNPSTGYFTAQSTCVHRISADVEYSGHEGTSWARAYVVRDTGGSVDFMRASSKFPEPDGDGTGTIVCTGSWLVPLDSGDEIFVAIAHDSTTDGDITNGSLSVEETLDTTGRT